MEKKSSIIAIGLTVHQTPVQIREQLSIAEVKLALAEGIRSCSASDSALTCSAPQAEWPRAIAELTSYPHIEEAAVLSTCNRMELYVVALSRNRVSACQHTLPQQDLAVL